MLKTESKFSPSAIELIWSELNKEAKLWSISEPALEKLFQKTILDQKSFKAGMTEVIASELSADDKDYIPIHEAASEAFNNDPFLEEAAAADVIAKAMAKIGNQTEDKKAYVDAPVLEGNPPKVDKKVKKHQLNTRPTSWN